MALKDKLMTLEDFKAVRDVDVASNSAQFTEIKADLNATSITYGASWEIGSITTSGKNADSTTRIRTVDYIYLDAKSIAVCVASGYKVAIVWYLVDDVFIQDDYWLTGDSVINAPLGATKIRIVIDKTPEVASLDWANSVKIFIANSLENNGFALRKVPQEKDLNFFVETGFYLLPYDSSDYQNMPETSFGTRIVCVYGYRSVDNAYRIQTYTNLERSKTYMRVRTGGSSGSWLNWILQNPQTDISGLWQARAIDNAGIDIDTLTNSGYYELTYIGQYDNQPWDSGRRIILVYPAYGSSSYIIQVAIRANTGEYATRAKHDGVWDTWKYSPSGTQSDDNVNKNLYAQFLPANSMRYIYAKGKMWADLWNTENAYKQAAADKKCWGISGDVQFTSDGKYIMYHDANITYNGESVPISSLTYEQVKSITLSYVGKQYTIPDFSTFLKICRDSGKVCFVESKGPSSAYAWTTNDHTEDFENIISEVLAHGMQDSVVFIVPSADIAYLQQNYPQLAVMVLCDNSITTAQINASINNPQRIVSGYPTAWTTDKVAQLHSAGRLAIGYTSRPQSLASIDAMIALNLDAVCVFREPPDPLRITDTTVIDYNNVAIPSGGADNSGIELTVMSYNVANYNNDTSVYINDEQIVNIKKLLSAYRPDIIGLQEHRRCLDASDAKVSHTYLYTPVLPFIEANTGCSVVSKNKGTADLLYYTTNRSVRVVYFTYNSKTLLFIDTHPTANYNSTGVDSADSIATRLTEYTELMAWIHGETTLKQYGTGTMISVQSWDWCIVTGDFNSITETDRTNLKTLVTARNFAMANGGWMGWLKTHYAGLSLDNILCSQNVIIDSVEVPEIFAKGLYSDHYPIISHVTLL